MKTTEFHYFDLTKIMVQRELEKVYRTLLTYFSDDNKHGSSRIREQIECEYNAALSIINGEPEELEALNIIEMAEVFLNDKVKGVENKIGTANTKLLGSAIKRIPNLKIKGKMTTRNVLGSALLEIGKNLIDSKKH